MGKLIRVQLSDIPVHERTKAAGRVMLDEPGEIGPLILAALAPSNTTYFVPEKAYRAWRRKHKSTR